jgi:ribosomal protein S18 acetylase RimI-like enzyme
MLTRQTGLSDIFHRLPFTLLMTLFPTEWYHKRVKGEQRMEVIDGKLQLFLVPLIPEYVRATSAILCMMDPWLTLEYRPEVFESYLLHADHALSHYAVMVAGEVAGVLSVRHPWLFGPFIELMALFDGFRGKGFGRRIIDWVCDRYQSPNVWATVSSFNLRAQKFYGAAGFEQTAILGDLIKPGRNEILIRKRVRMK